MEYLPEIRGYLFHEALRDLRMEQWPMLEEKIKEDHGFRYLEALLSFRDSDVACERASRVYRAFMRKDPDQKMRWDEEERLYDIVRTLRTESHRKYMILWDMICDSEKKGTEPLAETA